MSNPMFYEPGCTSSLVEMDERLSKIVEALMDGSKTFGELKRKTGFHQEVLTRKIRILTRFCIVRRESGIYRLCEDAVCKIFSICR